MRQKKLIRDLGLYYKKIDAYVNHYMLFWKEDEELDKCTVCDAFRWKLDKHSSKAMTKSNGKRISFNVQRYFLCKPRLQHLFITPKTTTNMTWHNYSETRVGL